MTAQRSSDKSSEEESFDGLRRNCRCQQYVLGNLGWLWLEVVNASVLQCSYNINFGRDFRSGLRSLPFGPQMVYTLIEVKEKAHSPSDLIK